MFFREVEWKCQLKKIGAVCYSFVGESEYTFPSCNGLKPSFAVLFGRSHIMQALSLSLKGQPNAVIGIQSYTHLWINQELDKLSVADILNRLKPPMPLTSP